MHHPLVTTDTDFSNAVRSASLVVRTIGAELRAAAAGGETEQLIKYLLSEKPLGSGERAELAELLSGELARSRGRPIRSMHDRRRRQGAYQRYKEVMEQFKKDRRKGPYSDAAVELVAKEFKFEQAQVRGIIKDRKMRS